MPKRLRSEDYIFLIGFPDTQILGSKLPSKRQVLSVFFYNLRTVKLKIRESASLAVRECLIFWEKARIPTQAIQHCISKLIKLYNVWRNLQKNSLKSGENYRQKEKEFTDQLDSLFDIAHLKALTMLKSEEDKQFLIHQRLPGRPGSLAGVEKKSQQKEQRSEKRMLEEAHRKKRYQESLAIPSTSTSILTAPESYDEESISSSVSEGLVLEETDPPTPRLQKRRARKTFITPKLVGALDRCMLSVRDSVYIIEAVAEALGHNVDDLVINRSSIHRCRKRLRIECFKMIKNRIIESPPNFVVVHWDGKLLPALNVRDSPIERLPIIVTSKNVEQLIGIPKINKSTGEEQASAVYTALEQWNLIDRIQALCCDTTASNMGRLNGAAIIIEQKLKRDLLYLPCRHHIYELILRGVFESKLIQVTSSPDIPLFKKFQKHWKNLNRSDFVPATEDLFCESVLREIKDEIATFAKIQLQNQHFRHDYRELLELVLIFLNEDAETQITIHPPGALHQARWMSRAIYCLKIYIFRNQFSLSITEESAVRDICVFIVRLYVKAWFGCPLPIKAPSQDLEFLKSLKTYESIDPAISKAALRKFCNHLWYLSEEAAALAFFDDTISPDVKKLMVQALQNDGSISSKRLILQSKDIDSNFIEKSMDSFISEDSKKLFSRFAISSDFMKHDPTSWEHRDDYVEGKEILKSLNVVNDVAERGVKLMQDYHGSLAKDEEQKQFLLCCVQEHRRLYPDCGKETLKKDY